MSKLFHNVEVLIGKTPGEAIKIYDEGVMLNADYRNFQHLSVLGIPIIVPVPVLESWHQFKRLYLENSVKISPECKKYVLLTDQKLGLEIQRILYYFRLNMQEKEFYFNFISRISKNT